MNLHNEQYYALTDVLGISNSQKLQGFLDTMFEKYNVLDLSGFQLAPMQTNFTFEQVISDLKMNVMASYVDLQSEPIPIGTEGFSVATGSIPRQKMREVMDEIKMREMYMLQNRRDVSSDRALSAAAKQLYVSLDNLFGGHYNSMTYQRHQVVSTGGFATTTENNPLGIKGYKFESKIPTANKVALSDQKQWWTDKGTYATEGTAADPIADLQSLVDAADNAGVVAKHFEIDKLYAKRVLSHTKVIAAIAANQYPLAGSSEVAIGAVSSISFENKLRILGEIVGAPFVIIDHIASVQKFDKASKKLQNSQIRSFAQDVIVLVPDGNIGQTLSVEPLRLNGGMYGQMMGGRLLLNISYDYAKKIQAYETELTALVVPDKPNYMFYLYPSGK